MKFLGIFLIAVLAAAINSGDAAAATLSASGQIKITARVADAHYVIVDSMDSIIEITSNTDKDVTPRIYRGNIRADSEIPLTTEILSEYRKLVPAGQGRIGTLYKNSPRLATESRSPYLVPTLAEPVMAWSKLF